MPATRPPRRALEGSFIRLEPLEQEHLPALFRAIGKPEVFAGGYGGGPAGYRGTEAEFIEFAQGYYGWLANKSMLTADQCAEIGLRALEKGRRNIISGALNKLSCFGVRLVPRKVSTWMSTRVLGKPKKDELPGRAVGALK